MKLKKDDFKKTEKIVHTGSLEVRKLQVWSCKIGVVDAQELFKQQAIDFPMRQAVTAMFMQLFGRGPEFLFSGWNAELTDGEIGAL